MRGDVWLVHHKDGTCALKVQNRTRPPDESVTSVPTLCAHFVILPHGFSQGWPDCEVCVKRLNGNRRAK